MGGYALPPSLGMFSIQASPTKWNTPMICQWFVNEWFPAESFWMLEFPQSIFETRQHGQFPFLLVFQSWLVPMFTLDHHAGRLLWTLSLNGYNYATNTWIGLWGPCGPMVKSLQAGTAAPVQAMPCPIVPLHRPFQSTSILIVEAIPRGWWLGARLQKQGLFFQYPLVI